MKIETRVWTLDELILAEKVKLGRGNIISKKDIAGFPGEFPIYSSAREKNGTFGYYGKYMFDEELITWSIDGGGRLFYRPRHKFSVTNVGGTLRIIDTDFLDCRYLHLVLTHLHSKIRFDWVYKAHPSVIRTVYNEIPIPSLEKQREIVEKVDSAFTELELLEENLELIDNKTSELLHSLQSEALASIENEWQSIRLVDLGKWITGSTPSTTNKEFWGNEVPFVTPADLSASGELGKIGRQISKLGSEQVRVVAAPSVLLVCIGATLGKVNWTNQTVTTNQQINALQVDVKKANTKYAMYLLSSLNMQKKLWDSSTGTTVPILNKGNLESIVVSVPSLEIQNMIVERLDSIYIEIGLLRKQFEYQRDKVSKLRQSLLSNEFSQEEAVA